MIQSENEDFLERSIDWLLETLNTSLTVADELLNRDFAQVFIRVGLVSLAIGVGSAGLLGLLDSFFDYSYPDYISWVLFFFFVVASPLLIFPSVFVFLVMVVYCVFLPSEFSLYLRSHGLPRGVSRAIVFLVIVGLFAIIDVLN